jgi:hypothetical protein
MPLRNYQSKLVLYAHHEAGHAVVWHGVNGLVEEVSISSNQERYQGYCRFGFLLHTTDNPTELDMTWNNMSRVHPKTVTAYYAGMLAMAYYCASYQGEDDYLEGSERDDLEQIDALLLRLCPDEKQRATMKQECWMSAQKILSEYWPAVQALAQKLLKYETLDGRAVHRVIWQTIGYPDSDWRLQALNIKRARA